MSAPVEHVDLRTTQRPWLSPPEAGAVLGLRPGTVYRALAAGQLPSVRVGRRLLVPVAKLRAMFGIEAAGVEAEQ